DPVRGLRDALLGVLLPTVEVAVAGAVSVARVKDAGPIQPGIPAPALPDIHLLTYGMITGALSVAVIIMVQGAGVAEATRPGQPGRHRSTATSSLTVPAASRRGQMTQRNDHRPADSQIEVRSSNRR